MTITCGPVGRSWSGAPIFCDAPRTRAISRPTDPLPLSLVGPMSPGQSDSMIWESTIWPGEDLLPAPRVQPRGSDRSRVQSAHLKIWGVLQVWFFNCVILDSLMLSRFGRHCASLCISRDPELVLFELDKLHAHGTGVKWAEAKVWT